jgi:uncharacterized protein (TIGR02594 family)
MLIMRNCLFSEPRVEQGKLEEPRQSCIVVLQRKGGNHVGFYLEEVDEDSINLLGGNQSNAINVKPFNKENVLSFRWPQESDRMS